MFKVQNQLPLQNYSTEVISSQAGTIFKYGNNNKITLDLPSSLGMIDTNSSYLSLNVKLTPPASSQDATAGNRRDSWKMKFINGTESIIKRLRVLVDGRPLEDIDNYNVLSNLKKDYTEDFSGKATGSLFDHADLKPDTVSYFVRSYNAETPEISYSDIGLKQRIDLNCSGLFCSRSGIPLVSLGKISVEIELARPEDVLVTDGVSQDVECDDIVTDGTGNITLFAPKQIQTLQGKSYAGLGWDSTTTSIYAVGNVVKLTGKRANNAKFTLYGLVSAITDTAGSLEHTVAISGLNNAETLTEVKVNAVVGYTAVSGAGALTTKNPNKYEYEVDNVNFVARVIEMPPQYMSSMSAKIASEGLIMDVPTYANFRNTLLENVPNQTINIPCFNSRVKSSLTLPLKAQQTDYAFDMNGQLDGTREYQFQIGADRYEPSRPVNMLNTILSANKYPSQEHLVELQKAIGASGKPVRSLLKYSDNFVVGRSFSFAGSTEDLVEKGLRVNLAYNSNTNTAKQVNTWVYMIKRIVVNPQGVTIVS